MAAETQDPAGGPQGEWANASIRCEWTLTGGAEQLGQGGPGAGWHRGRPSETMLDEVVPDVAERVVYVCGPQGYMDSLVEMVNKRGVPMARIYTETFETQA